MASITAGQTGTFTLDAFGYIDVVALGDGTLSAVSRAPNLKSNVSISKLASVRYGPYGVPMDFTIACTNGTITYTTTDGYSSGTSSGGIATSSGSDITAMTITGGEVSDYTAGIKWVITRDGSNVPLTQYLDAAPTLETTLTQVGTSNYFAVTAGPKFVSGALILTKAQHDTLIAATPTITKGFRIFVSDIGALTDEAGTVLVPGAFGNWDGTSRFLFERVVYRNCDSSAMGVTTTSGTTTLCTLVIPQKLAGPCSFIRLRTRANWTTAVGNKQAFITVNGTQLRATATTTINDVTLYRDLDIGGALNVQGRLGSSVTQYGESGTGTTGADLSIDTSTTDITVTFGVINSGADSGFLKFAEAILYGYGG